MKMRLQLSNRRVRSRGIVRPAIFALLLIPLALALGGGTISSVQPMEASGEATPELASAANTLEAAYPLPVPENPAAGSGLEQEGFVWSHSAGEARQYAWSQGHERGAEIRDDSGYLWSRSR